MLSTSGPTHKYKILCAFSQKRVTELQAAVKAPDLCMNWIRSGNPLRESNRCRREGLCAWRPGWFLLSILRYASYRLGGQPHMMCCLVCDIGSVTSSEHVHHWAGGFRGNETLVVLAGKAMAGQASRFNQIRSFHDLLMFRVAPLLFPRTDVRSTVWMACSPNNVGQHSPSHGCGQEQEG